MRPTQSNYLGGMDAALDAHRHRQLRNDQGWTMRPNPSLLALAAGAFGIGISEFAPMGLLVPIASDLRVTIPTAGLLVSGYAVG